MIRPTDRLDDYMDLHDAIATLPLRQRRVVFLYYECGLNQAETAIELQITQQAVSELLEKAVVTCKNIAETHIY